jgi:hypothetical protein
MEVNGGVGTIFSRLAVEGPIVEDKSSFIIAGRRSYIDILARPFSDVFQDGAGLYFYDLTAKTNYNLSDRDRLYLSGYLGRDVFNFSDQEGINWGSKTLTFRWNHLFNERLFSNLTLFLSDYDYQLAFGEDNLDKFEWTSNITTTNIKPGFTYFLNPRNEITFGGEFLYYHFEPANAKGVTVGEVVNFDLPDKYAAEYAVYLGNEQKFNDQLSVMYGLRFSGFHYLGEGNYFTFNDTTAGFRRFVERVQRAGDWETIQAYHNWEPRLSMKYQFNASTSIKASYNRTVQYIHLVSNTTASNPLDIWTPSTNNIEPQTGNQLALGFFKNFLSNSFESSLEVYYRETDNQIDYIDGADLFINEEVEGDLLSGIGRAYGMEFYLKKNRGDFTGWISYTLARTELKIDGINFRNDLENRSGQWYPTRFDQTHNLKLAAFYALNPRVSFGANFTYLSGTPTTFPTHRYEVEYLTIPENAENSRNNLRIPAYHRLDLSLTIQGKDVRRNGKPRRNDDSLVITLYNVYNRRNPFSIYFAQVDGRFNENERVPTRARQVSILGSVVPSVTYNFRF